MKLGGLFSGIGGFELAWTRLGHEVAWMCEVDPKARKVLEARFPGVPVYPDVQELDPAEVEAVDVLTGGSPCQGFSIAGQRTGLLHGESRLFADYVRIVNGLAERGLQYALWENVPGVLSIKNPDGERTFPHVIGALAGGSAAVRLDPRRKWNVGLVANGERAVAWRVLDSRYFGVAQRRRRVFACVAFGDSAADRAGRALLAVAKGVRGDSAAGVKAGEGAAGGVADRAGVPSVAGTLGIGTGGNQIDTMTYLPDYPTAYRMTAIGEYADDDTGSTLKACDHKEPKDLVVPKMFNWQQGDAEYSLRDDSSALAADSRPAVLMTMRKGKPGGGKSPLMVEEESLTLATGNGQTLFQPQDELTLTAHETGQGWWNEADHAGTLRAEGENRPSRPTNIMVQQYGVRRLTPVECERLQAFPDGWTEPAGSDSARYKALGNAVTVNTVGWILRRMVNL